MMVTNQYRYRIVQGMAGNDCLGLVLPSKYTRELGIAKGDVMRISRDGDKVIVEKV